MAFTKPTLVNYTLETFSNDRDLQFHLSQWERRKTEFLPKLKAAGLIKFTGVKVWNKEGTATLGWIFEYEDADAFKRCQDVFKEIEREENNEVPVIRQAFRGVVIEEEVL